MKVLKAELKNKINAYIVSCENKIAAIQKQQAAIEAQEAELIKYARTQAKLGKGEASVDMGYSKQITIHIPIPKGFKRLEFDSWGTQRLERAIQQAKNNLGMIDMVPGDVIQVTKALCLDTYLNLEE